MFSTHIKFLTEPSRRDKTLVEKQLSNGSEILFRLDERAVVNKFRCQINNGSVDLRETGLVSIEGQLISAEVSAPSLLCLELYYME